MSDTVKVFRNMLSLMSERFVVPLVNLLLVVAIARYLGAEGLGRYALIVGFVSFFDVFLDLGINTLIIREVARDKSVMDAYASRAVTLKLAVSPLILVSIFVFLKFFSYPPEVVRSFYIFSAAFILFAFSETFNALYKACERMNMVALMVFLRQSVLVAAVIIAVKSGYGIIGIAYAYLAVGAAYLGLNYILFNMKVDRVRVGVDRRFYVDLFNSSLPFITLGFIFLLFYRIDVVLISLVAGDAEAGFFSATSKITSSLLLLSAAFLEAVFPIISRYGQGSPEKMREAVRKSFHMLSAVSFPVAVGLIATGGGILRMLYGGDFTRASSMFYVLAACLPLAYLSSALHYVVMARNMQRRAFFGILLMLVAFSAAVFWAVKAGGGLGAAYATLAFTAAIFVFLGYLVFGDLDDYSACIEVARPLIASLLMGGALYYMGGASVAVKVAAGVAVYVAAMLLLKGFNSQDLAHLRDLWGHYAGKDASR